MSVFTANVSARILDTASLLPLNRLRSLSLSDVPAVMAAPPTLTWNTATGISSAVSISASSTQLTWAHTTPFDRTSGFYSNGHVSYGTVGVTMDGDVGSVRFETDAPIFDIKLRANANGAQASVWIDGQPVSNTWAEADKLVIPRFQSTDLLTVDFGTDTKSLYLIGCAKSAAGASHAAGDVITLGQTGGAASTPAKVQVTQVSAGAITGVILIEPGVWSTLPTSPVAQASTTGSGTGATFTFGSGAKSSARKTRRVEVFFSRSTWFLGLNVGPFDIVRPWNVKRPRVVYAGDSITAGFQTLRPEMSFPAQCSQRLGIEDWWSSGLPGTGYLTVSGSSVKLRDRITTDIVNLSPDLVVISGMGYNDNAQVAATLQAEVTLCVQQLLASLPNAYFVFFGSFIGNSFTPNGARRTAITDGITAGMDTRRCALFDPVALLWETGGGGGPTSVGTGNAGYYVSSDTIHPGQDGHNMLGKLMAEAVYSAIRGWSL